MRLEGNIEIYDWVDQASGLTVRVASYDAPLTAKLYAVKAAAERDPAMRQALDGFNRKVLEQMALTVAPLDGEAPLYYWVRAMKTVNRLSFEDGEYEIPNNLAACIVKAPGARTFVNLMGG